MQKLVDPRSFSTRHDVFTPYQLRQIERLSQQHKLVNLPEFNLNRTEKGPISVLFYDTNNKLNLWRIGQHNVLAKKVSH